MKAFVTGASGFIGSYLVKALVDKGHEVLCLKRPTSKLDAFEEYINKVKWVNNTEEWTATVRSFKPHIIYHLAWNGVAASDRTIWEKQVSNIAIQQELLDLALEVGCKNLLPSEGSPSH